MKYVTLTLGWIAAIGVTAWALALLGDIMLNTLEELDHALHTF